MVDVNQINNEVLVPSRESGGGRSRWVNDQGAEDAVGVLSVDLFGPSVLSHRER